MKLLKSEHVGMLPCFCVSTNTGQYSLNGLTHHNSVAIQNVIMHAISHKDKIAIGLVDIKQVEFSNYKDMAGVVGVANSVRDCLELLRIAKIVMYRRNKEMASMGIKQVSEHIPSIKSGLVYVSGREYKEDDLIKVKIDGREQEMKAKDLVEYLHSK